MTLLNEKINFLIERRGINTKTLAKETGIPYTTLLDIVKGKTSKLDIVKGIALAKALGCKTEYLVDDSLNIEDLEQIPINNDLSSRANKDIYKEMQKMQEAFLKESQRFPQKMQEALINSEGLLFDGEPASEEAIVSIMSALSVGMEIAKKRNKEKYTPKKYK